MERETEGQRNKERHWQTNGDIEAQKKTKGYIAKLREINGAAGKAK